MIKSRDTGNPEMVSFFVNDGGTIVNLSEAHISYDGGAPTLLKNYRPESADIAIDGSTATLTQPTASSAELRFLDHGTTLNSQTPAEAAFVEGVPASSTWTALTYSRTFGSGGTAAVGISTGGNNKFIQYHGGAVGSFAQDSYSGTAPTTGHVLSQRDSDFRIGAFQETLSAGTSNEYQWYAQEELITTAAVDAVDEVLAAPDAYVTGVPTDFFEATNVTFSITSSTSLSVTVNGTTTNLTTSDTDPTIAGFTFDTKSFFDNASNFTAGSWTFDFNINSTTPVVKLGTSRYVNPGTRVKTQNNQGVFYYDNPTEPPSAPDGFINTTNSVGARSYPGINEAFSTGSRNNFVYEIAADFHAGDRGIIRGFIQAGLVQSGTPITDTQITSASPDLGTAQGGGSSQNGIINLVNGAIQNMNGKLAAALTVTTTISYNFPQNVSTRVIRNAHPNLTGSDSYLHTITDGVVQGTTTASLSTAGVVDGDTIAFDSVEP